LVEEMLVQIRKRGEDLLITREGMFWYREGVWRHTDDGDMRELEVEIQRALDGAKVTDASVAVAMLRRLTRHPDLFERNVKWDPPGLIGLENGVLNVLTGEFVSPTRPEHRLRRKRCVVYDPAARAPEFEKFIAEMFANQPNGVELVGLIQEFFGASMCVNLLNREQRRGLLLKGPSYCGKTELAELLRRLIGDPFAASSVADMGTEKGLTKFYGATGWVADDAVKEGDKLDAERFKKIVTGEPIEIDIKYGRKVTTELQIPVLLTMNELPAARDSSDAIINRCLVVYMTLVFTDRIIDEKRKALGMPKLGEKYIANHVFKLEGAGIFNWCLAGLKRIQERGAYRLPEDVKAANQAFKDESNRMVEFARIALEPGNSARPDLWKVHRTDVLCAYQAWWREQYGDEKRLPGMWHMKKPLLNACQPWLSEGKIGGDRYLCGGRLTAEGLTFWQQQRDYFNHTSRGVCGTVVDSGSVNNPWSPLDRDESSKSGKAKPQF
jgi:P4 family phage/plasmid primase-like protien